MTPAWDDRAWAALEAELARWAAAGRPATLWWRDDDAGPAGPALDRLLALAETTGVPLALAAVPAWLEPAAVAGIVDAGPGVTVVQHGFAHRDHEPRPAPGARRRKAELGDARSPAAALAELAAGGARLAAAFGPRYRPVLVPPWNRIAPALVPALPAAGYRALSAMGPRAAARTAPGLAVLNCHVDPIRWREDRAFAGADWLLRALADQLAMRRQGRIDAAEPTGLLTHHQDLDPGAWACLGELLHRLRRHPAIALPPLDALLARPA
ncbi:MAG TPA: hypothetical protein VFC42_09475 [Methylomirabilota bacterium]|jgi:hypothetical protein|nr:hypothetical protein [Methylomirabilota bacterium]